MLKPNDKSFFIFARDKENTLTIKLYTILYSGTATIIRNSIEVAILSKLNELKNDSLVILYRIVLINKLLILNCIFNSIIKFRAKTSIINISFSLENSLLYYKRKLVVLKDEDIRTYFIQDIYT